MRPSIYKLFEKNVQKTPKKAAVIYLEQQVSYEELNRQVLKLSTHFVRSGLTPGQRVGVFAPNGIEFVVTLLAIAKLGIAAVPLPISLKGNALITALKKTPVAMVVAWPTIGKVLLDANLIEPDNLVTLGKPVGEEPSWEAVQSGEVIDDLQHDVDLDAPFILTMTSGSTGQPKPIVLSQACKINRATDATIHYYGLSEQDVVLVATPMYHSLAQRGVLMPLILGATTVVLPKFNLTQWLSAIETHKVSFLFAVAAQLESLVVKGAAGSDLSSLRCLVSSSAVLEGATKKRLLDMLSCRFHECYGASEVGVVTDFAVSENPEQSGSVGKALPFVSLKITDDQGCEVATGQVGEICCNTSTIFGGYLKMPEQTRAAFYVGDFFKTGDLGYVDEQGYLYYVGRKKEVISSGGINVFPQDIETIVKSVDGVEDCVAFGVKDALLGEVIKLVVEQNQDKELTAAIRKVCLQELTDYQQPRFIELVDALPRNQMGKVLRNDVKTQFS
ncbi:class I adenylate-forming enzyme family protein [Pseudoalteromonas piscicida]|uniref:AMP-dependent synthetase n=1 Tax=Pseudoalteromonas piscicida TaxID=43662 RepID=A0A2A5JVB9_PSEO7|nr:class I adenylate-forming enzyme family protein [Pseudoalteromonas piscicida]PCK33395.1 AMP-dependent synthetase [Pseudoalteromonas piscicida]